MYLERGVADGFDHEDWRRAESALSTLSSHEAALEVHHSDRLDGHFPPTCRQIYRASASGGRQRWRITRFSILLGAQLNATIDRASSQSVQGETLKVA
jgi:hypothetical protein